MMYLATTRRQLLKKIAFDYVRHGYYRYAIRTIPQHKDPLRIDKKLLTVYDITLNRTLRQKRRQKGLANIAYIRYQHLFVLLATEGMHEEFDQLDSKDIRCTPIYVYGYSIGFRGEKVSIELSPNLSKKLTLEFNRIALKSEQVLKRRIETFYSMPYPGVIKQRRTIIRRINTRRKKAGLSIIS